MVSKMSNRAQGTPCNIYHLDEAGYVFNDDSTVWMSMEEAENRGLTESQNNGV